MILTSPHNLTTLMNLLCYVRMFIFSTKFSTFTDASAVWYVSSLGAHRHLTTLSAYLTSIQKMRWGLKGEDHKFSVSWWAATCFEALIPRPWSWHVDIRRAEGLRWRYHAVVLQTNCHTWRKGCNRQSSRVCEIVVLQVERLERSFLHFICKVLMQHIIQT